jgi:hypothetical protein
VPDAVARVVAVQSGGVSPAAHSLTLDGTTVADPTDWYPAFNNPVNVPGVSLVRGVKTIGWPNAAATASDVAPVAGGGKTIGETKALVSCPIESDTI